MIRVLLVDDHAVVRAGLRRILTSAAGIEVVGETGTGEEAVALARELKPHVVVMDLAMPGMGGIEATKRIVRQSPRPAVLILTVFPGKRYGLRLLRAGALGYLEKRVAPEKLVEGVYKVARGEYYLPPELEQEILRRELAGETESPADLLTDRELEVLCLMAQGKTASEVARELKLSRKTVDTYRFRIRKKLGLRTSADYLRFCLDEGLL
jgi:two-component system invasion response regulator UvrY